MREYSKRNGALSIVKSRTQYAKPQSLLSLLMTGLEPAAFGCNHTVEVRRATIAPHEICSSQKNRYTTINLYTTIFIIQQYYSIYHTPNNHQLCTLHNFLNIHHFVLHIIQQIQPLWNKINQTRLKEKHQ